MLGRKSFERAELDNGRRTIGQQLESYRRLADAVEASGDGQAQAALAAFEPGFLRTLVLALDRLYVHRLRSVTGKDGNALNEVELLTESLMNNQGVFRGNNVIRFVPADSVVKLSPGDQVELSLEACEQLADAFFSTLESRFVAA